MDTILIYYIKSIYITLYYIILHLTFTLLLIYNVFRDGNGKVNLESFRL